MAHRNDDDPELDRAAILARRQRFIALALSGLATTCGDDSVGTSTGPMPCLSPVTASASASDTDPTATASATSTTSGTDTDVTSETSGDTSGGDASASTGTDTDTAADSGSDSTGRPQPCLAPKG